MRIVILSAVAAMLVATPAVSTAGGITSFEFQEDYVLVGENVAGRAVFYTNARGSGRIEDGPWHAYLLPKETWIDAPRIPAGAVDLGPIAIEDRGDGTALATITFTVPDMTTGGYSIGVCNVPCTEAYVGDLGGGWLSIARTEEGATLLRALDNSSVTPPALVDTAVSLARRLRIPLQVGTTNGGNDGSVFTQYGVPDIPIGWPLRYSHSPAETLDLRDMVSLADMIRAIAQEW
jgi:hypothetical protein